MATQPQRDAAGSGTGLTAASDKAEKLRDAATKHAAKHAKWRAKQDAKQEAKRAAPASPKRVLERWLARLMEPLLQRPPYRGRANDCKARAVVLLHKMKKSTQTLADFGDPMALWGYTAIKFRARALLTFQHLSQLHRAAPQWTAPLAADAMSGALMPVRGAPAQRPVTVVSVGGGPGNDLFGAAAFLRLCMPPEGPAKSAWLEQLHTCKRPWRPQWQPQSQSQSQSQSQAQSQRHGAVGAHRGLRLAVADFAGGWAAIVGAVETLMGVPVTFLPCDVTTSIDGPPNERFARDWLPQAELLLFSFVLHESKGWLRFLLRVWACT